MKKFVKNSVKKKISIMLSSTLVLAAMVPSFANSTIAQNNVMSDAVATNEVRTTDSAVDTDKPVEITTGGAINTAQNKDFSISIGEAKLAIKVVDGEVEADINGGNSKVYYAKESGAYVSIDLNDRSLTDKILTNNSQDVIESLFVNSDGNVEVAFKAEDAAHYIIKVQDQSQFTTKIGVKDIYTGDFANDASFKVVNENARIQDEYTFDSGLFVLGRGGEANNAPYFHDGSHGLAINNGNYIDVAVAGNATITFNLCKYGADGTLAVSNLADNGAGEFDVNHFKGAACNEAMVYTYTGDAAVLRFTLNNGGESYLHGVTVKNTGDLAASPVEKEQASMPNIVDALGNTSIIPVGHQLKVSHSGNSSIGDLTNVGYYLFDATQEACKIEADITIESAVTGSSNGLFFGLFSGEGDVERICTLGMRGGNTIRNIYNKKANTSTAAGGINTTYKVGDKLHVSIEKTASGMYTELTAADGTVSSATVSYSNATLFGDINTNVRYGFALSNVEATIKNLKYTDEAGNVLYDQTDCYAPIGDAPQVYSVDTPVVSADRTSITVNWEGTKCQDDAAYQVMLSKDGGATFELLAKDVTAKSYTAKVDQDGEYMFAISGVCGNNLTEVKYSSIVDVIAPLASPVLSATSGDSQIGLSWEAVEKATSYEVYRRGSAENNYKLIQTVETLSYTDTDVVNEEPYYYYVVAKCDGNESNPSETLLMVPSAGREGKYVYENEAADIFVTKKSYDTVYKNSATLEGRVDRKGTLTLEVNGAVQETVTLESREKFAFNAALQEGRNDVNLLFTDEAGKVTRKTFNFVYLTNYDIVVDASYTGKDGEELAENPGIKVYSTVEAAINSVPSGNTDRVVILIKEGNYRELLRIETPNITLIGEDREKVNINFYDSALTPEGGSTSERCAIYIKSAAKNFVAENLTFENTYEYLGDGTKSNESADAVRVDAEDTIFVNVKMLGYQDTLQANASSHYLYKCYILGNVDFIYGSGQALFDDCEIVFRYNAKKNSGYVTAPKTDAKAAYGYTFNNCSITSEEGCSGNKYLLARPWGPDGAATFINTYMGSIINPVLPYADMGNSYKLARFSEYYTYGPGFAINSDRPQISKAAAEEMLTPSILGWDPYNSTKAISQGDFVGSVVTVAGEKFIEKEYNNQNADINATDDTGLGAFKLEGYAQNVTGGGALIESADNYYKVATAKDFLAAIQTAKETGKATVIELKEDINLGSLEIGDALTTYSSVIQAAKNQPLLHPTLLKTGVSKLNLKEMSNLTIFSQNGSALKHVCVDISGSSNIMIRNIVFDEIWEWDEDTAGDYDRNDWDYITIQNGSTDIWIDHCTFYKAYDGLVDVKKALSDVKSNVTISWCEFLPESESAFFDEMMDLIEANPEAYPYYTKLLTEYGMTKEQVRAYTAAQKKGHLVGASDTEANTVNLQVTLANNYYKNIMDRMPRMRGGNAHVYNCIMDAAELYTLRNSIENPTAQQKVVSNGAISTCGASVLVENTYMNGIMKALASGNASSPAGYINAVNSVYYMNGEQTELTVTENNGEKLVLDADQFIEALPYSDYNRYMASNLENTVMPRVGAGKVSMNSVQWQKTTYNDPTGGIEDVEKPEVTPDPKPEVTPDPKPEDKPSEDVAKELTVTFNYQGATSGMNVTSIKVTEGKPYGKLPAPSRRGYRFVGWYATEDEEYITEDTIVTAKEDHTLYAKWKKKSSGSSGSGNNTSNNKPGNEGNKPSEEKPENPSVSPEASKPEDPKEEGKKPNKPHKFDDVKHHWAEDAIDFVIGKGILKGMDDHKFAPNVTMTRAMFATVLYRLAGEEVVVGDNAFRDVADDTWYTDAVIWANQKGIVNGIAEGQFDPNAAVTREQMAAMLYEYITVMDVKLVTEAQAVSINDEDEIASWAKDAFNYMTQNGIMQGDDKQNAHPKAEATRAEVSTMIHRIMNNIK